MSFSFYVKHKKKLFFDKTLSIKEVLSLVPGLSEFGVNKEDPQFDWQTFLETRMKEGSILLLGIDEESARGFEFGLETLDDGKRYYRIRVFTPSGESDWKHAFALTKALAEKLGESVITEYGDVLKPSEVDTIDYRSDILFGIKSLFATGDEEGQSSSSEIEIMTIFGIFRPVAINREIKEKLLRSKDPVKAFSDFVLDVQYSGIYPAKQTFYKEPDGTMFGAYTLMEETDIVLPYKPFVEFEHIGSIDPKEVKTWKLNIVGIFYEEDGGVDVKSIAVVDYKQFMAHVPKEKYSFFDANYIELDYLSREEIYKILDEMGVEHQ